MHILRRLHRLVNFLCSKRSINLTHENIIDDKDMIY